MAVQKQVVKGLLAGAIALMLSGCVTVPDAIKGSSPTPQDDLVRVMKSYANLLAAILEREHQSDIIDGFQLLRSLRPHVDEGTLSRQREIFE